MEGVQKKDPALEMKELLERVDRICQKAPHLDRDIVRHTLILLAEPPIERLRRSLRRGHGISQLPRT